MTTQTRRPVRIAARVCKATRTGGMVGAVCGVILWGAVAAQAATTANGLPCNELPTNGMPCTGRVVNGLPYQGMPINGMPFNGVGLQGMPMQGLPRNGLPMHDILSREEPPTPVQHEQLPWHTISRQGVGQRLR